MNRIKLAVATVTFLLIFPVAAFPQNPANESARKAAPSQKEVPVQITDEGGRSVKLESLTPENRARVERVRKAAMSLVDEPGTPESQRLKSISIDCHRIPGGIKCTITVE
jgi:hypothetical protein